MTATSLIGDFAKATQKSASDGTCLVILTGRRDSFTALHYVSMLGIGTQRLTRLTSKPVYVSPLVNESSMGSG